MLKLLLVVILLAAATYVTLRVIQRRGLATGVRRPTPRSRVSRVARGPLGPDDDEEFLRDLDRKRLFPDDPDS